MPKNKPFNYQLTESDVKTLLSTLLIMKNVLPTVDIDEFDLATKLNCLSFGDKATKQLSAMSVSVSHNELSAMHVSLQLADMINCSEIEVDPDIKKQCSDYFFSIKHLLSVVDSFFA